MMTSRVDSEWNDGSSTNWPSAAGGIGFRFGFEARRAPAEGTRSRTAAAPLWPYDRRVADVRALMDVDRSGLVCLYGNRQTALRHGWHKSADVLGVLAVELFVFHSRQLIERVGVLPDGLRRAVDLREVLDERFAIARVVVVHEEMREGRSLAVVLADLFGRLKGLHSHPGEFTDRDVIALVEKVNPRGLQALMSRVADREPVSLAPERLHVAGDPLDNPEIALDADFAGHRPAPRQKLMRPLVIQRRIVVAVGVEKEVGDAALGKENSLR